MFRGRVSGNFLANGPRVCYRFGLDLPGFQIRVLQPVVEKS